VGKRFIKLSGTSFYFFNDVFNGVAFAEDLVAEMHAKLEGAGMQPGRAIDEELSIIDGVLFLELTQKQLRQSSNSCLIEPYVQNYVGSWINCRDDPILLTGDFDDRLIKCDVLGIAPPGGSRSALCTQLWTADLARSPR
jgi:hypothetical protein